MVFQSQQTTTYPAFPKGSRKHTSPIAWEELWFWLILIVGVMVRLYRLDFQSLWADEGLQYFVASAESFKGVLARLFRTVHPPLSFLVNHVFLQIGNSEFFLRFPSALFGIGSLPLCYLLAKRMTSQPAAIFTMLVCAMSPFHVWYSQEGRMYAQLLFFSLLSTLFLLQAVERDKWPWWALYMLSITVGIYTHIFMALGVMAQCLWMLLCHRRRLLAYCVSGIAAILLCLSLVAPKVGGFLARVSVANLYTADPPEARLGFSWAAIPYTFFVYGAGFSLGPSVAELHGDRSVRFLLQFLPSILVVGITFGTLLIVGMLVVRRQLSTASLLLCLLGLVIPFMGVTVLSLLTRFTFNARYTIVAFPYFCILIGMAVAFIWRKNALAGTTVVLVLLGITIVSLAHHFFNPRYAKEDLRSGVAYWRAVATHEYLLGFSAGGGRDAINYYLDGSEKERYVPIGDKKVVANINTFFAEHDTSSAYLILARDWYKKREKAVRHAFVIDREQHYPGVIILRVSRR